MRELLRADDEAVSEVLSVVLLVAVVVILATTVAAFALGITERATSVPPRAAFSFEYDDSTERLRVEHTDGQVVRADRLYVRGRLTANSNGERIDDGDIDSTSNVEWAELVDDNGTAATDGSALSERDGLPAVGGGDFVAFPVGEDARVAVVYENRNRNTSATFGRWP